MTFPGNLPAAAVSGTLRDTNGDPLASAVATLVPSVNRVVDPTSGDIFYAAPATFTTGVDGTFTVNLIPTNDPDESPINWWYQVSISGTNNASEPFTDTFRAVVVHDEADLKLAALIQDGATNGTVNPVSLGALVDVDLSTGPTNGQALVYDSTAQKWKAGTVSGGGGSGLPTGGTSGQLLKKNSSTNGDAGWADPPTIASLGGIPSPSSIADGQVAQWDASTSTWVAASFPSAAPFYVVEASGSYPPRPTSDPTRPGTWDGVDAPTIGETGAVDGVDLWARRPA